MSQNDFNGQESTNIFIEFMMAFCMRVPCGRKVSWICLNTSFHLPSQPDNQQALAPFIINNLVKDCFGLNAKNKAIPSAPSLVGDFSKHAAIPV